MNKKIIIIIIAIILVLNTFNINKKTIPDESIRVRIVANSNTEYDQRIKKILKDKVQTKLFNILSSTNTIVEARKRIANNYENIDQLVKETLEKENYNLGYKMNYGYNYFPEKEFNGEKYSEGEYESLLITLGEGKGDNWWCVLFPPLCIIEADENKTKEVEYDSILLKLIKKVF